jgi:hypothetical protein
MWVTVAPRIQQVGVTTSTPADLENRTRRSEQSNEWVNEDE